MADKLLIVFEFFLQTFLLCTVSVADEFGNELQYHVDEDFENTETYESYDDSQLSPIAVVGIVLAAILGVVLKVWCCYCRYRRRATVVQRTICVQPVRTVGVVVVRDRNPLHAGYDQGTNQPTSSPPYVGNMPQTGVPNLGSARPDCPPPYTAAST